MEVQMLESMVDPGRFFSFSPLASQESLFPRHPVQIGHESTIQRQYLPLAYFT
jgi:hypothetical protein